MGTLTAVDPDTTDSHIFSFDACGRSAPSTPDTGYCGPAVSGAAVLRGDAAALALLLAALLLARRRAAQTPSD